MEADWSVEIGPEMPVIDPLWHGLVDLLRSPHRISEIEEAVKFPPLLHALLQIHQQTSQGGQGRDAAEKEGSAPRPYLFWTAKCDLWQPEEYDADEMNAAPDEAQSAIACYIDLLPRTTPTPGSAFSTRLLFAKWSDAERSARSLALFARSQPLSCARADFVVRSAITAEQNGFGITVYLAACGSDERSAADKLASALKLLTETLAQAPLPHFAENPIPLQ